MNLNDILGEYFSQATKCFSKVTRTWIFTIIASTLTFVFKAETITMHWLLQIVVILAIVCILLDGIQYFYISVNIKSLLAKTTEQKNNGTSAAAHNDAFPTKNISENEIKVAMNNIHANTFKIIVAKFCVLIVTSLLLLLYMLIFAK